MRTLLVAVSLELPHSARKVYALQYQAFDLVRPMQPTIKLLKNIVLPMTRRPFSKLLATSHLTTTCFNKVQLRKLQCIFKHRPFIQNFESCTRPSTVDQQFIYSCLQLGIAAVDRERLLRRYIAISCQAMS